MPVNEPPREELPPVNPREEAQVMLGQIHGVVWTAVSNVDSWLETQPGPEPGNLDLTSSDIRRAANEIHPKFGLVHAALNSGEYDTQLADVGFASAQGPMKRKGLWSNIKGLFRYKPPGDGFVVQLRKSLRWSGTILGSLGAALKKEVEHVPGAAAAAEAIKEFVEVMLNATESSEGREADQPTGRVKGTGRVTEASRPTH